MSKKLNTHGKKSFDTKYYKRFFEKYNKSEFDMYYRWVLGWIGFLKKYSPVSNGNGKSALEVGSSLGYFSKVLKENGFDVDASDISSHIVKKAKKIQKDIDFRVIDVEKKIKTNKKYDLVVAFEVLEHLDNPEIAMKNIYSILKKGGTFIFSTPFLNKKALSDPTHINVHEEKWWLNLGKDSGFKKRIYVPCTFIPYMYRLSSIFSVGFKLKTNLPYINSTAFYIFTK